MTQRIDQLNALVQQEVGGIILREVEFQDGVFLTISRVEVAPDAESAKVFVSIFPDEQSQASFELLNQRIAHIQGLLNKRLHMKFVPKISFVLDHTEESVASLNALLDAVAQDPTLTPIPKKGLLPPDDASPNV